MTRLSWLASTLLACWLGAMVVNLALVLTGHSTWASTGTFALWWTMPLLVLYGVLRLGWWLVRRRCIGRTTTRS